MLTSKKPIGFLPHPSPACQAEMKDKALAAGLAAAGELRGDLGFVLGSLVMFVCVFV